MLRLGLPLVLMLVLSVVAAACGGTEEVVKEVEVIKEVEVVKEVEVIKEVEVVKEVVKLVAVQEGVPSVVTDSSAVPSTFNEAPTLAAMVASGELPPVDERLPEEPLVIQTTDSIGKYGGTLRSAWVGNPNLAGLVHSSLLYHDTEGGTAIPWVAKDYTVSNGGKTFTFFLRKGMKWSDGAPLTADDIIFWYEDIQSNKDLTPNPSTWFKVALTDEVGVWEKVDDYTVRVTFERPYGIFPNVVGSIRAGGHFIHGGALNDIMSPKHYMMQFHPKYTDQAEVDKMAKDEGFENWQQLFRAKNSGQEPDSPVLTAWRVTVPTHEEQPTLERNPYYFAVDTEGNQLPYIDTVVFDKVTDPEVLYLRTAAGRYDFQQIDIFARVPFLLENAEKGNYGIRMWRNTTGTEAAIIINLTYDGDAEVNKWINNKDFRIALSTGFNREELNEIFWLGMGEPGSHSPVGGVFHPGREYVKKHTQFDPQGANEILDGLGLDKREGGQPDGLRLRTDKDEPLVFRAAVTPGEIDYPAVMENIAEQLQRNLGIRIEVEEMATSAFWPSHGNNDIEMYMWTTGSAHPMIAPHLTVPYIAGHAWGTEWGRYFQTGGKEGTKPPDGSIAAINQDLYVRAKSASPEETVALMKEALRNVAENVLVIGTISGSPALLGTFAVSNNLGNVPETGKLTTITMTKRPPGNAYPSQWYFKN